MQQALTGRVKLIVTDSKLAFMQGGYEESLRLAEQALDIDRKNPNAHQCAGTQMQKARSSDPKTTFIQSIPI